MQGQSGQEGAQEARLWRCGVDVAEFRAREILHHCFVGRIVARPYRSRQLGVHCCQAGSPLGTHALGKFAIPRELKALLDRFEDGSPAFRVEIVVNVG